jgi:hypothetical protein
MFSNNCKTEWKFKSDSNRKYKKSKIKERRKEAYQKPGQHSPKEPSISPVGQAHQRPDPTYPFA